MNARRFLVSWKKILKIRGNLNLLITNLKENIYFWEGNIDRDAEESVDSINDPFDEIADKIMEPI